MRRPRVTINAAVLATAIRIQARLKTNIRTVVARDNRFRAVAKILRFAPRPLFHRRNRIDNVGIRYINMKFLEAIGRAPRSTATVDRFRALRRFVDDRAEFALSIRLHDVTSSHEHIRLSNIPDHRKWSS